MTVKEFEELQTLIIEYKKYKKLLEMLKHNEYVTISVKSGEQVTLTGTEVLRFSFIQRIADRVSDIEYQLRNVYHLENPKDLGKNF